MKRYFSEDRMLGSESLAFVAVTDRNWFEMLQQAADVDEVNFWQPSASTAFRALQPGQPFLFKLHSPDHYIVGGGFFVYWTDLPVSLAWKSFEQKNGALTLQEMRVRIEKYRRVRPAPHEDYKIGCILLLRQAFFFFARRMDSGSRRLAAQHRSREGL